MSINPVLGDTESSHLLWAHLDNSQANSLSLLESFLLPVKWKLELRWASSKHMRRLWYSTDVKRGPPKLERKEHWTPLMCGPTDFNSCRLHPVGVYGDQWKSRGLKKYRKLLRAVTYRKLRINIQSTRGNGVYICIYISKTQLRAVSQMLWDW